MIKFVLLDIDDTLFDFSKAEHTALSGTLSEMGVEPTDSVIKRYSEINREHWERLERRELTREQVLTYRFDALYRELGAKKSSVETQRIYEYRLSLEHPFIDGAEELLRELYGKYKLYIVSNGTAVVQDRRIADSGIGKFFDGIFISQRVGADKPAREFFDSCFAQIEGFESEHAIIVGDSLTSDILGGKNAGIKTCHFNPDGKKNDNIRPDYEIKSLRELPALLGKL
ncbi:MAG: YjjG family noncanonical pyrimidine nucleotidase [Clostridia bacterium]|nr:YjjG family noncanonical pyrimidine nucleotidase [Clostridia bacterium]